jgi:peptide/nickel transport system ATP-binding protein
MLQLHGVSHVANHSKEWLLRDVNISISPGEWVMLLGESGSGKSMTAQLLIEQCMANHVPVSWVPQQFMQAFPPTVRLGDFIRHVFKSDHHQALPAFIRWAEQLHLDGNDLLRKTPEQCSGGMLQRTALALAFSRRTPWIIADEPTSALDAENRQRVLKATANYIKQEQTGVLWITHHEQETLPFADRVFYCHQGMISPYSYKAEAL